MLNTGYERMLNAGILINAGNRNKSRVRSENTRTRDQQEAEDRNAAPVAERSHEQREPEPGTELDDRRTKTKDTRMRWQETDRG